LPCFRHQHQSIRNIVLQGDPIIFTLPAFPCKSPNPAKVLGRLPDMAETLSLRFLRGLCEQIEAVYDPGARMVICSDGHVFGDLIGVPDSHIDEYFAAVRAMIVQDGSECIDTFTLGNVYGDC